MEFVDIPDKKQKHPHYEHQTYKLDLKDNEFSSKKFQQVRKISTQKRLIESFGRIGMCLNDKTKLDIPTSGLNKICLILMNDQDSKRKDLGVGPLNDGYLIGLKHHRLGFKIFYLYNPKYNNYLTFLKFFMKNTTEALTVFYSGPDDKIVEGIEFEDGTLSKGEINEAILTHSNGKTRVLFITDSLCGSSVFDIDGCKNMISLSAKKTDTKDWKEIERTHGIFTYYFCKITSDCPDITPNRLIERMNPSIGRFNEKFTCILSNKELEDSPIFFN